MKVLLFFCIPFLAWSQTTFTEHIIDTSAQTVGTKRLVAADMNNDGKIDLASLNLGGDEVFAYKHLGQNNFDARQTLADSITSPNDVCFGDFDGDGWQDMATLSNANKNLIVNFNQNGVFANNQVIDSNYFFPIQVFAQDFTNDGHTDILAVDDTVVRLLVNDGLGTFTKHTVATGTEYYCGGVGDLNGDSMPDILLGSVKLYTYINNGNGNFTRDMQNESLINQFVFQIEIDDIDGDGDNDAALYYSNTTSNIDWYANDSAGTLSLGGSITTTANDVKSMKLADFTGDGLPDFVTAYGQSGELVWMENLGSGVFSSENVLKTYTVINRAVAVADADGDGDIDIFCGHNFDGIFYWENLNTTISIPENIRPNLLWPNPAKTAVKIVCQKGGAVEIHNASGAQMATNKPLTPGENLVKFDLKPGVYIFRWTDGNANFAERVIIK